MKKSAFISDIFFTFFVVFLPAVCFLRYKRLTLSLAVLVSALLGIAAALVVYLFLSGKNTRRSIKLKDEAEQEKFLLHLILQDREENLKYFSMFAEAGLFSECDDSEKSEYQPIFTFTPLDPDKILPLLRSESPNILLCNQITEDARKLCDRFKVKVFTGVELYPLAKQNDLLPDRFLGEDAKCEKRKRKFRMWFHKSNSRRFLVGGILLLITSLITPFPLYYLIFGSVLILSAVFVRIFGVR